ncbi:MAG: hypothetical protein ABWZ99_18265 [Ilumatobacteraceae bacterium]
MTIETPEIPDDGEHVADPPDFDRSKVPDGPAADYFFDGRTGRGLTDHEWDEQSRRAEKDPHLWAILHGRPLGG